MGQNPREEANAPGLASHDVTHRWLVPRCGTGSWVALKGEVDGPEIAHGNKPGLRPTAADSQIVTGDDWGTESI